MSYLKKTEGTYSIMVSDLVNTDSKSSKDAVKSVNIEFTANDGKQFKIDQINVIHKPDGAGDHTFYGGIGLNKMMHENTGVGTNLMPKMVPEVEADGSDHNIWAAETHVILIPQDMGGNLSPVPGTNHGFIHMMWENAELTNATRDWKQVYEILPGPAAVNEAMSPAHFAAPSG